MAQGDFLSAFMHSRVPGWAFAGSIVFLVVCVATVVVGVVIHSHIPWSLIAGTGLWVLLTALFGANYQRARRIQRDSSGHE